MLYDKNLPELFYSYEKETVLKVRVYRSFIRN